MSAQTGATPTDEALADVRAYQEAKATAEQHGYDTHVLRFLYTRYQFGSLACNHEAADMRRRYWAALQLAEQRKSDRIAAAYQVAAE